MNRIAQQNGADTEYYLGDDLNSVRQLTNSVGDVTLAKAYDPYGNTILNLGNEKTACGCTGEYTDSTGQIYLRARYYDPEIGRFTTKDTWNGDYNLPITLEAWLYANANPIMYADPTGNDPWRCGNDAECYAQWIANYQLSVCDRDDVLSNIVVETAKRMEQPGYPQDEKLTVPAFRAAAFLASVEMNESQLPKDFSSGLLLAMGNRETGPYFNWNNEFNGKNSDEIMQVEPQNQKTTLF